MYGRLWFAFLLHSPSYELARKHREGLLSATDHGKLPEDIETVLAVYDNLGDVRQVDFTKWWMDKGIRYFGYKGDIPVARPIDALLAETTEPFQRLAQRVKAYIEGPWLEQGRQPSLIVAIPLGISKADLIDQLANMIDGAPQPRRAIEREPPTYSLHGRKKDTGSIVRLLQCLTVKAENPKAKLYEVGAMASLSSTYSSRFSGESTIEDRNALKILTSRALSKGLMMAENAARGIFPSYEKCEDAVAMDWPDLGARLEASEHWQELMA